MRRIALVIATVGLIAVGIAGTPAQAHDGGWQGHQWQEQQWREDDWRDHHDWRAQAFERHVLPQIIRGFVHR